MNRAACPEAVCLRHLKCLGNHTLPGKCGIAVHEYGYDFLSFEVATALLTCPHRTLDDRIDNFQMRRVEREHDVHVATRGLHVRRISLVVFHVA